MNPQYSEIFDPGIPGVREPELQIRLYNGATELLTGERALAAADDPIAETWRKQNPAKAYKLRYIPNAAKDTLAWKAGEKIRQFAYDKEPTLLGCIMDKGPLPGGLLGAGTGLLGGLLAGWLKEKITGDASPMMWGLTGSLLGGLGGSLAGHLRTSDKNTDSEELPLHKQAAMYHDPRNFILEKLQSAHDIGYAEKAKLAAAVRNLDYNTASRLADAVRAAVGFGIGALISKFIFKTSGTGTFFGGLAGILGANVINRMTSGPSPVTLNTRYVSPF